MCADKNLESSLWSPKVIDSNMCLDINHAIDFEILYKEVYKIIDNGIILITEGKKQKAHLQLNKGLELLDQALSIDIKTFDVEADQMQIFNEMQIKMKCTRKEVLIHFADTQSTERSGTATAETDAPPSYNDYLHSLDNKNTAGLPVSYPTLEPNDFKIQDDALEEMMNYKSSSIESPVLSPQNGEMIFQIENGVQIFFVYANGKVTSPSYPSFLAIFTFSNPICENAATGSPGARGFIQVGEWNYPLVPAQSPVLHSFYGAYMFPDPNNSEPGTSVGILIPDTVDKDTKEMFELILIQMTSYQEQNVPEGVNAKEEEKKLMHKSTSTRISEGAEAVSRGLVWGAGKLSEYVSFGSDKLKDSIQPEVKARAVDPKWQTTAKVARNVSGSAVKVSGFVLNQLGKATLAIGKKVAPTIQKHGTKAVGRLTGQGSKEANEQVEGVMEVASGAVKGFSTIYMSLENAATILAKSVSDNTVKVVSHKYGPEYGSLTNDTLHTVGQTAMAGYNISSLGVKGIAKRTAKDTGIALIDRYAENPNKSTTEQHKEVSKSTTEQHKTDSKSTTDQKEVNGQH